MFDTLRAVLPRSVHPHVLVSLSAVATASPAVAVEPHSAATLSPALVAAQGSKQKDPLKLLDPSHPRRWDPVLRGIVRGEIKATSEIQTALVHCMSCYGVRDFNRLLPVVEAVGAPMRNEFKIALARGEWKGVKIREIRLVEAALRIGPAGRKLVQKHIAGDRVSMDAMEGIRLGCSPEEAVALMAPLLERTETRAMALRGLRRVAQLSEIEEEVLAGAVREIAEPIKSAARAVTQGIDPATERPLIEEWLTGDDELLAECAAWAVGRRGAELADMVDPLVALAAGPGDEWLRATACWAIGSLAEPGPTCVASGIHFARSGDPKDGEAAIAIGGGPTDNRTEEEKIVTAILRSLDGAVDGVAPVVLYSPPNRRMTENERNALSRRRWLLTSSWLDETDHGRLDESALTAGSAGPGDDRELPPSALEALSSALASNFQPTRLAALAACCAWNVAPEGAVAVACQEVGEDALWMPQQAALFTYLHRRIDDLAPHVDALSRPRSVDRRPFYEHLALLARLRNPEAANALVQCLLRTEWSWTTRHVRLLDELDRTQLSEEVNAALERAVIQRYEGGEFPVLPLVVRMGEAAHPTVRRKLLEGNNAEKLFAAGLARHGGSSSRPLLDALREAAGGFRLHWKEYFEEIIETISEG